MNKKPGIYIEILLKVIQLQFKYKFILTYNKAVKGRTPSEVMAKAHTSLWVK